MIYTNTSKPNPGVQTFKVSAICAVALSFGLLMISNAHAGGDTAVSWERVYWTWNDNKVQGHSKLIRSEGGLKAKIETRGLGKFNAFTLWFVVFNNPDACATDPCTVADLEIPDAQGDFLYGGGIVTSGGFTRFSGKLDAGDSSGSGFPEIGAPPEAAIGLTNPMGADVLLAIHSHGPATSGATLKSQVSSFAGGCLPPFLGDAFGWAEGRSDIPRVEGECSTLQVSTHEARD